MSEVVLSENLPAKNPEAGVAAVVAREQSEIQAAVVLARKFPRDESAAYAKMIRSFERPSMAEAAEYIFPRGGQKVSGPSVECAREIGRCWGNLRYGFRVLSADDDMIHIEGYAYDLETNTRSEIQDKFARLVQRKSANGTIWVKPDERDLRELINRRGAICERNALLKILPPDMVSDVLDRARKTLKAATAGELKQSREEAIRRLVLAFDHLGVNAQMLTKKLGHDISLINETEMAELRAVYKSIYDGNSSREEHFEFRQVESQGASDLNAAIKAHVQEENPLEKAKARAKKMLDAQQ